MVPAGWDQEERLDDPGFGNREARAQSTSPLRWCVCVLGVLGSRPAVSKQPTLKNERATSSTVFCTRPCDCKGSRMLPGKEGKG